MWKPSTPSILDMHIEMRKVAPQIEGPYHLPRGPKDVLEMLDRPPHIFHNQVFRTQVLTQVLARLSYEQRGAFDNILTSRTGKLLAGGRSPNDLGRVFGNRYIIYPVHPVHDVQIKSTGIRLTHLLVVVDADYPPACVNKRLALSRVSAT